MSNGRKEELAITLLHADSEQDVIKALRAAGYWDDPDLWRLYGDRDGNYATIGNQQSRPEAALVEKLINSVDARLLNECLIGGIDPTSTSAPQNIRDAIALFFENRERAGEVGGLIKDWEQKRLLQQARFITLAVTGGKPPEKPSITVSDNGEGQTPARMSETFLSIDRSNKLRIPFVQGKFNMGSTGALKFCGQQSLQLILTRRNPKILTRSDLQGHGARNWGFTVVRRERPTGITGAVRNSVYRYLAPEGSVQDRKRGLGQVLSFAADSLPLLPDRNKPYARDLEFGSVVKLYEYDVKGFGSHALMKGGLLTRLEILLPEIALPVRVHECRAYRGEESRSFENSLVGIRTRLTENVAENLEPGYPAAVPLKVHGEQMTAEIYAFKGDKADSYRSNEGIIFAINGQTHGAIPKTFFERSRVKMGRLARSLLVVVDCSDLSVGAREDLFMNSRDRLSNGELRKAIEAELEDVIGHHEGLRALREKRRNEEIEERLKESKPLEDVLDSILKSSPTLSRLFLQGQRLSRPHRGDIDAAGQGGGEGGASGSAEFKGKSHPTFFRFHKLRANEELSRSAELGRRCRIRFDTDVVNDYFFREGVRGRYDVEVVDGPIQGQDLDHHLNLFDGVANWSISLPEDQLKAGDKVTLQCSVTDDTLAEPFVSIATITVAERVDGGGGGGQRKGRTGGGATGEGGQGPGGHGGKNQPKGDSEPGGITLPDIVRVREDDDQWKQRRFDEYTACQVEDDGDEKQSNLTFYINMDNRYIRTEIKGSKTDSSVTMEKFIYANVLMGLALIHDFKRRSPSDVQVENGEETPLTTVVERTTRALAPFIVPMIDYLGALTPEEVMALGEKGDDD